MIFFSDFYWHNLGFLVKILIFLGFLCKINCQDGGKKSKKPMILATNEKIQDLDKKFKIIQDDQRSWQENQDTKHWVLKGNFSEITGRKNCQWLPPSCCFFCLQKARIVHFASSHVKKCLVLLQNLVWKMHDLRSRKRHFLLHEWIIDVQRETDASLLVYNFIIDESSRFIVFHK